METYSGELWMYDMLRLKLTAPGCACQTARHLQRRWVVLLAPFVSAPIFDRCRQTSIKVVVVLVVVFLTNVVP